jgi:hypothetical protein
MKAAGAEAVLLKDEIHALDETIRQWTLRQKAGNARLPNQNIEQ